MAYMTINGKVVKVAKNKSRNILAIKAEVDANTAERLRREEIKQEKGKHYKGNCNVTTCQRPGAVWWNKGSHAYYCRRCAERINAGCDQIGDEPLCSVGIHES